MFEKVPPIVMRLWPNRIWRMPGDEDRLFLTFDDGPTPGVTDHVLDRLAAFGAKATFFCIGKQAEAHPELLKRIAAEGHSIGNHSYSHPKGWETAPEAYLADIEKCQEVLTGILGQGPRLFRPPYGKAGARSAKALGQIYRLVMWDVLSCDFEADRSKEEVLELVTKNAVPGSVIVFHDSVKCAEKMRFALEGVLSHFSEKGFQFEAIPED